MSQRDSANKNGEFCSVCREYIVDRVTTDIQNGNFEASFCPVCNTIIVRTTTWGSIKEGIAGHYDDMSEQETEELLLGLTEDRDGDFNPYEDIPETASISDPEVTYIERDAAEELDLSEEKALEDENVRVTVGVDETTEERSPSLPEPDKDLLDPPETVEELREVAPELFENDEPDENTRVELNPTYNPPADADWRAF